MKSTIMNQDLSEGLDGLSDSVRHLVEAARERLREGPRPLGVKVVSGSTLFQRVHNVISRVTVRFSQFMGKHGTDKF